MSNAVAGAFQGHAPAPGGKSRTRRVQPPTYGAQAFHSVASPSELAMNDSLLSIGPPPKKSSAATGSNGLPPTSSPSFQPLAAPFPSTSTQPSFTTMPLPAAIHTPPFVPISPLPATGSEQLVFSSQTQEAPLFGSGTPPPGGKRDPSASGSHRTRRLAAPVASFASPAVSTSPNTFVPLTTSSPPESTLFASPTNETPTFSGFTPTIPHPSTPSDSKTRSNGPTPVSVSLSPSVFGPVGKGADLFDVPFVATSASPENHIPIVPASPADFFDFGSEVDDDLPPFGSIHINTSSPATHAPFNASAPGHPATPLAELNGSPEPTPGTSPAPLPNFVLSGSADMLFEDDDTEHVDDLFGAKQPSTNGNPDGSNSQTLASPVPSSTAASAQATSFNELKVNTFNAAPVQDLFSGPTDDELDFDFPTPATSSSTVLEPTKKTPVVEPSSVSGLPSSTRDDSTFSTPPATVQLQGDTASSIATNSDLASTIPLNHSVPEKQTVHALTEVHSVSFVPASLQPTDVSLFGDSDGEELVFGASTPVLPNLTEEKRTPLEQPAQVDLAPTSYDQIPSASTTNMKPETLEDYGKPSDTSAPTAIPSEPTSLPLLETVPSLSNPESVSSFPPPSASSAPKTRAGTKRPRHFQYTAGQPITVPTVTVPVGLPEAPPKSNAHTHVHPPKVATMPPKTEASFVPVSAPTSTSHVFPLAPSPGIPASSAPIDNGAPLNEGTRKQPTATQADFYEPSSAPPASSKRSLFEPLGQLQSKGLNWFKTTFGSGGDADIPEGEGAGNLADGAMHDLQRQASPLNMFLPPSPGTIPANLRTSEPSSSPEPSSFAPSASGAPPTLPEIPVGNNKKRKPARPGAFKSTFVPTTPAASVPVSSAPASAPIVVPSLESAVTSLPTTVVPPVVPYNHQYLPAAEDHPFSTGSALVSIDLSSSGDSSTPSHRLDPFNSDDNVAASDLFQRLRSEAQKQEQQHNSSIASHLTAAHTLNAHHFSAPKQTSAHDSFPVTNNKPISITLNTSSGAQSTEPALPNVGQYEAEIASLTAKVSELTAELERTSAAREQQREEAQASSRMVSMLQSSERELKTQLTAIVAMKNDSTTEDHQHMTTLLTTEQDKNRSLQEHINQLMLQNSQLQEKLSKSEEHALKLEKAHAANSAEQRQKLTQVEESHASEASKRAEAESELLTRISQLEHSLQDARRNSATAQALATENEKESYLWKSKYESEVSLVKKMAHDHDAKMLALEEEMSEKLKSQSKALILQQERLIAEARELGSSRQVLNLADIEKKHAEELSRIQQENERYVALMQQQAASQTSVIDRLIHQNADLVKAVEFARRVLQESKNPDSVGALVADNDRLQEELESSEKELATLRQRTKEVESRANYFEEECEELVRRLNSIDYRLLVPSSSNPPQADPRSQAQPEKATHTSPILANTTSHDQVAPQKDIAVSGTTSTAPSSTVISTSTTSEPSAHGVPPTPVAEWQPKSPVWSPTISDSPPGKTPSRFTPSPATTGTQPSSHAAPVFAPAPFVVTAPLSSLTSLPGLHHDHLSPQINLDDLRDTVSMDLDDTTSEKHTSPPQSPNRPLKVPPQRGLFGRIWQAVTLQ